MHAGVKQAGSKEVDQVAATEQAAEPQVRRLSHGLLVDLGLAWTL